MNTESISNPNNDPAIMVIRMNKVIHLTGLSKATIWRKVNNKTFPIPIKLGSRAIGWYAHEIEEYLLALPRINTLID